MSFCACGCGQTIDFTKGRKKKSFIHGHHVRVDNAGAKARKGTRPWNKGKPRTQQEKDKISANRKGIIPKNFVSPFYIDGRYKNDPNSNFNQYGGEFTIELKLLVRHRDNFECQNCGKKKSVLCHHIDENKLNNTTSNLVILCKRCHGKFHTSSAEIKLILTELFKRKVVENEKRKDNRDSTNVR